MLQPVRRILACLVGVTALGTGVSLASSRPPVFPIPGLAAARLSVDGVARLSDGGALVAASLSDGPRRMRPAIARLLADGSIDLAYGREGLATLRLGPDQRVTSLAIDPQTGEAWLGVAGPGDGGELLAVNGAGVRRRAFGHNGSVALGARNAPVTLAWNHGELLVASGPRPCAGCSLSVIDGATGSTITRRKLTPAAISGSPACSSGSITSAVLPSLETAQLAFLGAGHCGAQIVTVGIARRSDHRSPPAGSSVALGRTASAVLVSTFGSAVCAAVSNRASTMLGPFRGGRATLSRGTAGGRLIALVSLGEGACAALLVDHRHPGGLVVQASPQRPQPTPDGLPRAVTPLGMFRCHAHLLIIGTHAQGRSRAGTVVVIPVRRGPSLATGAVATRARAEPAPRCALTSS